MKKILTLLLIPILGCRPKLAHNVACLTNSCTGPTPVTKTLGEMCPEKVASGNSLYYENDKICAQTYVVKRNDEMNGWTYVHIIGLQAEALFKSETDADVWVRNQPYVRPAWQVR